MTTDLFESIIGNAALGASNLIPEKTSHLKRFPFIFLVDTSGSTGSLPDPDIDHINTAIGTLLENLRNPPPNSDLAHRKPTIDLCIISYNDSPTTVLPWTSADALPPSLPPLAPWGCTATSKALVHALREIRARQTVYGGAGTPSGMPHIFHLTDGYPTDIQIGDPMWNELHERLTKLDGSQNEKSYARLINFISPRGLSVAPGAPMAGLDIISQLAGANSVFPLGSGTGRFETLIKMVTVIIRVVSSGHSSKRAMDDAVRQTKLSDDSSEGGT